MDLPADVMDALEAHPCYNEAAHSKFARMHLPVAPRCNVQCNYCNRKYDCSNESRPGVTSEVLNPNEAVDKVADVLKKIPELKVIAIAGPGDPLANEETFETIRLIRERFPDMTLCISTNGLALPENVERLYDLGVRFVTVTVNAVDTSISAQIYSMVLRDGKRYEGTEAAEILLKNQLDGIHECVSIGIVVKVNVVLIPGINDSHIPHMVRELDGMGVYTVNVLPLIPVEGTVFSNMRAPTPDERKNIMDVCDGNVRMMRHCRQCRADAIGLLGEDRSQEFIRGASCGSGCGPKSLPMIHSRDMGGIIRIAVASSDGSHVDRGFGNAGSFISYTYDGSFTRNGDIRTGKPDKIYGDIHDAHLNKAMDAVADHDVIIVREIGPRPMSELSAMGKRVIVTRDGVDDALRRAVSEE